MVSLMAFIRVGVVSWSWRKDDSTDFNGVLRRFGVRDGSTAVFFVQIVLQGGIGVLQGGVEGVKRLELRVKSGLWYNTLECDG